MKLRDGEQEIKRTSASYIKGKFAARGGVLTMTNQRLMFGQRNAIAAAFGALGVLVLGPLLPQRVVMDLPLGQIASFSRGKYGLTQNVVVINTRDGQNYRFVAKFDDWAPVFMRMGFQETQPASNE